MMQDRTCSVLLIAALYEIGATLHFFLADVMYQ